ncbi:MAG: GntR family transcriptional regulator [Pseudomonadota bacterium]
MEKKADLFNLKPDDLSWDLPRPTLAAVAADKLREFILLEKIPPGAFISERDTAAALGISRTPLRSALVILEQEGLVDYTPTRRPKVADPSIKELAQNLLVMGALEALAGELACRHARKEDIARVAQLHEKINQRGRNDDPLAFFRADMRMHETIVNASGNIPLAETHRQYNARLWRARFISSRRNAGRQQTCDEHAAIVKALSARDPRATAAALRTHLASAIHNIKAALQERQETPNP